MVMSENLEVAVSVILFDGGTACSGTLQSMGTSLILAFKLGLTDIWHWLSSF